VSLAFLKNTIFPLFSTKHVALCQDYNTEIAYHKQSIQTQSTNQTIERCLFNNLDLLRCYDKKDMAKDHDL
jgi:hypothetical protein